MAEDEKPDGIRLIATRVVESLEELERTEANIDRVVDAIGPPGLDEAVRREQVDYSKWLVNLAAIVLTLSATGYGLLRDDERSWLKWVFSPGWLALAVSVFMNWHVVKVLTSIPVLRSHPDGARIVAGMLRRLTKYGAIRNSSFLGGMFFVGLGILLAIVLT